MEEELLKLKRSNNRKKAVIVLLVFTLVLAGILVFVFCCGKKEEVKPEPKQEEKKEDNTKLYTIVDGEKYDLYNNNEKVTVISFVYPQFNIDSADAKKANEAIKKVYDDDYNDLFKAKVTDQFDFNYYVKKGDSYYGSSEVFVPEYNISETDKYISISIVNTSNCSGIIEGYGYVFDKTTKKLLTNEEILKLFNKTASDFITYYNKHAGCEPNGGENIKSVDEATIFIKDKEIYFNNSTCCCDEISKYE